MTRDEMFKLINSTGAVLNKYGFWEVEPDELESFFALVAAHEREWCINFIRNNYQDHNIASLCNAIRARGQG